jgi:hypothetical protein
LEVDAVETLAEEAEEGRRVAAPETSGEARVGDEAAPALADGGDTREGGWLRGEADEDLREQVVIFQRRRRRRQGGAGADEAHLAPRRLQVGPT